MFELPRTAFKKRYESSIRFRFLSVMSVVLLIGTIVLSSVIAINLKHALTNSLMIRGQLLADFLARISEDALVSQDIMQLDIFVNQANETNREDLVYTTISNEKGDILTTQFASINYRYPRLSFLHSGLPKDIELQEFISVMKKREPIIEFSVPIAINVKTIGKVTLGISEYGIRRKIVRIIAFVIVLNAAVALALGIVLFIVSKKMILDPVAELSQATSLLASGDLTARVSVEASGEVKMLVNGFNHMLDNLEQVTVSKEYVDNIIKSINDALLVVDSNRTIILVNTATLSLLGYEEKELIGSPVEMIFDHGQVDSGMVIGQIHDKGIINNIETAFRMKDGRVVPLLFSGTSISLKKGLAGMVFVAKDITERKRAERSLAEKEARLRLLIETIPDLIWLKDADGIYLSCNKVCEQFFGAKKTDIVGKTDYDFVSKELADVLREQDRNAVAAGKPSSNMEWITFASDGHRALMSTIITPMYDAEGTLLGVLSIGRDVTEHQKLEEQLRHAQKLEGIGTLAGGIAHDFNNILSAIIGYGHITLMKMPKDDALRINIEHILESADRAAALTQSLLAFSRKQITNRKPIELNSVLKKVEKFLVRVIGEDVVVRLSLAESALTIFADAGQLEQVFMNLAMNARDAMPHGGSFMIETSIMVLDNGFVSAHGYGKPGIYALISATDTGEGMTEETRTKIFDPFFTTKEVGKGTGLGLAMVYGIIKQHEGFINVYSEPGKGTTFKIYLPLIKTEAMVEQSIIAAEDTTGGTETVLVAEDDATLRTLTLLVLEQMGYTVIIANDGEEAVTKFKENKDRIQLLLFDIIMPKKSGIEAYREIRKMNPDVHVLFASGYSPDYLRVKELIDEGVDIIYKPISPMNLLKKVKEALNRIQ
jgi:PAS domain S-box-containing protein